MLIIHQLLRSVWVRGFIFIAVVAGCVFGTKYTYDVITFKQNSLQIAALSQQTLGRVEQWIDNVTVTLSDLASAGLNRCDTNSLREIRRAIYTRGMIKDVQVIGADGNLLCSGVPSVDELGVAGYDKNKGYVAFDAAVTLHDINLENSGLIGVAWQFSPDLTYMAVLNVDALMFDAFPSALRNYARGDLVLGDTRTLASHGELPKMLSQKGGAVVFTADSDRYPLETQLRLSAAALQSWNREFEANILAFGTIFGFALGGVLVGLLSQPVSANREMQIALKLGEFVPYMQPTFSIETGEIVGCEVLTRWVKPDGLILQPMTFIPQAEENGMVIAITREIVGAALEQLRDELQSNPNFKVAFNIVPVDLVSEDFCTEICTISQQAEVSRSQIVLELTERQQFDDLDQAVAAIKKLQSRGFQVALDDTGTGHNGLAYVQELGTDIIKIDKHFVDVIGMDKAATSIIHMLVRLAADLGMTTIAEGIETKEQLLALRECKVDEGQGFLVSPPVPATVFLSLVEKRRRANAGAKRNIAKTAA